MKHQFLLTTLFSTLLASSCSVNDDSLEPGSYADSAVYATTHVTPNLEDEDEQEYIFVTDSGQKLFLADNMLTGEYEFEHLERIIIYFAIIEDYTADGGDLLEGAAYDCEYGLRLFSVGSIIDSESAIVTTQEESDAIADHAISYVYDNLSYSYNYINMVAGLRANKIDEVGIYVVENLSVEPEETKENYLNLELRYDRGTDEAIGSTYERFVSLNLDQFADRLEDMDGIILRVITLKGGTFYLELDKESETKAKSTTSRATL